MKYKYPLIAVIGVVLWLAETWYFGWNDKPENNIEKFLDIISQILIFWGVIGDILSGITIVKKLTIEVSKLPKIQSVSPPKQSKKG